jgi:hypothetical protein
VILQIADEVPLEYRDAIKASVATLARRSAAASKRALERSRAQNELLTAMARPLGRLLEEDAPAADALAAANRRLEEHRPDPPLQEPTWPTVKVVEGRSLAAAGSFLADQVFGPPWHYQWQWHTGAPPVVSEVDRPNGRLRLQTNASGDRSWSNVHGGFGVALTSHKVQSVVGRSLRRTQHTYHVGAGALGGIATVEGGMDMTVMEADKVLDVAAERRFRLRVGNGEEGGVDFDGWMTGDGGVQVEWVMHRDLVYDFNVGGWVFCDAFSGLSPFSGSSSAWARLDGLVISLAADFTD